MPSVFLLDARGDVDFDGSPALLVGEGHHRPGQGGLADPPGAEEQDVVVVEDLAETLGDVVAAKEVFALDGGAGDVVHG